MKIYFAGSIRGGSGDQDLYFSIITELQKYGSVLTEHIGNIESTNIREINMTNKEIFEKDIQLVKEADIVVAEVTTPSLGVGYELGQAEAMNKPVLCLYRETEGKRLSAMIAGNKHFNVKSYKDLDDITIIIKRYLENKRFE